jgi:putative transposase
MPFKETCAVEERLRFVLACAESEASFAELCRSYGVSRVTGYKWLERYRELGVAGLNDLSRAVHHHGNALSEEVVELVLWARGEHPSWGPKKLLAWLSHRDPRQELPSRSAVGELLQRSGLSVSRRRRRRATPSTQPFAGISGPNAVWFADFKGWFRTGDGTRIDPLTISDGFSRYLLRVEGLSSMRHDGVRRVFTAAFQEYGLPLRIRTDNGSPFASHGLGGLSRLSVWWLRLGIIPERIRPGHPEENGRHERMHLTLKRETANPPAGSFRGQQRVFHHFRSEFNDDRPHEALGQEVPSSVYVGSDRSYPSRLVEFEYPSGMSCRQVQRHGEMYWRGSRIFVGEAFAGERIGLLPVADGRYGVYFGQVRLGTFDERRHLIVAHARGQRGPVGDPFGG